VLGGLGQRPPGCSFAEARFVTFLITVLLVLGVHRRGDGQGGISAARTIAWKCDIRGGGTSKAPMSEAPPWYYCDRKSPKCKNVVEMQAPFDRELENQALAPKTKPSPWLPLGTPLTPRAPAHAVSIFLPDAPGDFDRTQSGAAAHVDCGHCRRDRSCQEPAKRGHCLSTWGWALQLALAGCAGCAAPGRLTQGMPRSPGIAEPLAAAPARSDRPTQAARRPALGSHSLPSGPASRAPRAPLPPRLRQQSAVLDSLAPRAGRRRRLCARGGRWPPPAGHK
jgi:hypothetical protein